MSVLSRCGAWMERMLRRAKRDSTPDWQSSSSSDVAEQVTELEEMLYLARKLIKDLHAALAILNSQSDLRSPRVTALLQAADPWINMIEANADTKIQLPESRRGAVH